MTDLLGGLNPPQRAAVTLPAEPALILAGAGSGKTRVLTTRIAWLIQTGQCSPHGILAVTFTNKAAREMQTRLSAMLPINVRGMWIGTFHGLCNRLLRLHHREAGLPQLFQILDVADQLAAVKRLLKNLNIDDEQFPPRELVHFINGQKEAGLRPEAVEAWDRHTRQRVELYREYQTQCEREGVVDFAELLLRSYELLARHEPIRRHYRERFRHILVDEFQDTNVLQYRWLKLLAGTGPRSEPMGSPPMRGAGEGAGFLPSSSVAGPPQDGTARGGAASAPEPTTPRPVISSRSEPMVSPPVREGSGEGGRSPSAREGSGEDVRSPSAREENGVNPSSSVAGPPQDGTARGGAASAPAPTTPHPVISSRSEQIVSPPGREGLGEGGCLFAVGDDDQSIYGFRGAEIGNMRDFEREFHVRNVIRLEQNYRSHGNILDAANAIIGNNAARLGKKLWTEAGAGEPIRVFEAQSDGEEARWIVEEIQALAGEGWARRQIALLYRANAQSRILEHALFSAGLAYRVYGGLRFFERQEIKHALAYLRLIANPDDDGAFLRVVNFPTRGIGARSLEQVQDAARRAEVSLYQAARAGSKAARFAELIDTLRGACAGLSLPETVEQVLEHSGLRAHYQSERDGQDRLANLDELVHAAESFVAEAGAADESGELSADLAAFLAHASLEAGEHQAGEDQDALQLMTVHSAKGLEFDAVFLSGLEEGLFPHENSLLETKGLEEERRLMYVAITRARQRLYLSHAQTRMLHGRTRYSLPSRFLDEIPEALLKRLTPRRQSNGFDWVGAAATAAPQRERGLSPRAATAHAASGFRIGQNVVHAKFGSGTILHIEGGGPDARVQVNFERQGTKWLALAVAKLTAA